MRLDAGEGVLSLTTAPVHAEKDRLPGDPGVWLFITADVFVFGLFFLLFSLGRVAHSALYERSRLVLNPALGLTNTLILLTSSWFMVLAVSAAREGARRRVMRNLALAMAVGSVFAVTKIIEYTAKIHAGITMLSNEFFTYYFVFTGVHFLHFLVGMVVLIICWRKAKTQPIDGNYVVWIESSGCYWHMVDLLWVILFPMLYLMRAT
jgi:nitric oxide reductase NorE protein